VNIGIAEDLGVLKELARAFLRFDIYPRVAGRGWDERSDWGMLGSLPDWESFLDCKVVSVFINFAEDIDMSGLSLDRSRASRDIGEAGTSCISWESSLLWHCS